MDRRNKGAFAPALDAFAPPHEGPLPEYFSKKGQVGDIKGLAALASSLGLGALAIPAPEAAPFLLPAAGIGAMGAFSELKDAGRMHDAADMWSNTGLPQRPKR
jgi:hypothetical protein